MSYFDGYTSRRYVIFWVAILAIITLVRPCMAVDGRRSTVGGGSRRGASSRRGGSRRGASSRRGGSRRGDSDSLDNYISRTFDVKGQGAFGTVQIGTNIATKEELAIKIFSSKHKQAAKKEIIMCEILRQEGHSGIAQLRKAWRDKKRYFLGFEPIKGGDLYNVLCLPKNRMPAPVVAHYGKCLADTLAHIKTLHMNHYDVKPENILITVNGDIKLCDMGCVQQADAVRDDGTIHFNAKDKTPGTPGFIAPELLNHQPHTGNVDVYSYGVVLYKMFFGSVICGSYNEKKLRESKKIDQDLKDLILKCVKADPAERFSFTDVLNHEFFKKYANDANEAAHKWWEPLKRHKDYPYFNKVHKVSLKPERLPENAVIVLPEMERIEEEEEEEPKM